MSFVCIEQIDKEYIFPYFLSLLKLSLHSSEYAVCHKSVKSTLSIEAMWASSLVAYNVITVKMLRGLSKLSSSGGYQGQVDQSVFSAASTIIRTYIKALCYIATPYLFACKLGLLVDSLTARSKSKTMNFNF